MAYTTVSDRCTAAIALASVSLLPAIFAVRDDDQGFAAVLFLHELIAAQEDGVIEGRAAAVTGATAMVSAAAAVTAAPVLRVVLGVVG